MNCGILMFILLISCCCAVGVIRLETSEKVKENKLKPKAAKTKRGMVRLDVNLERIKELEFKPDPVYFGCIHNTSMTEFDVVRSDDKIGILELSEKLNNGRDLSLFFLCTGETISKKDRRFINSFEWFIHSDTNICYIAYAFNDYEYSIYNLIFYIKRILETNRVEFIAKETSDLLMNVRKKCLETQKNGCLKHMSQVIVVGYSLGSHIGAYACRYLFQTTGEKVKKLIGLDPAAISIFEVEPDKSYIKSGDAEFVQVIHTSYLGTQLKTSDSDIYINSDNWYIHNNHRLAVELHELISAKKLILIASQSGNSKVINLQRNFCFDPDNIELESDECIVGVYSHGHQRDEAAAEEDETVYEVEFPNKSMKFY
ncbi:phospholipase A1-like [Contarinia nasturtii]|uniref:phospholipase A1-like n=1 Tax=Contarinia nasturtii TaxID=265458 RepID=UPI0012D47D91|nr:phospholipase A1-like [Contarinia nasturtii]